MHLPKPQDEMQPEAGFKTTQTLKVKNISGYHGKAHISLLQSRPVISPVSCYCDNLPLLHDAAVDDAWTHAGRWKQARAAHTWTFGGFSYDRRASPLTSVCLSVGEDRASTRSLGQILSMRSCSICAWWREARQGVIISSSVSIDVLQTLSSLQTCGGGKWIKERRWNGLAVIQRATQNHSLHTAFIFRQGKTLISWMSWMKAPLQITCQTKGPWHFLWPTIASKMC